MDIYKSNEYGHVIRINLSKIGNQIYDIDISNGNYLITFKYDYDHADYRVCPRYFNSYSPYGEPTNREYILFAKDIPALTEFLENLIVKENNKIEEILK